MKKFIMMIVATVTMVSAVFASTKVKVHCEEGDIITYIYYLSEIDIDQAAVPIMFDKYIEHEIEHVLFKDGTIICVDRDFKQGTWASEVTDMVRDNSGIYYVSANFADAVMFVHPYKGHVITEYIPRE